MSNTRCSLKGCSGVGDTLLVSPEVKYVTSSVLPISPVYKATDYSQSKVSHIHTCFLCAMGLKKAKQDKNPLFKQT